MTVSSFYFVYNKLKSIIKTAVLFILSNKNFRTYKYLLLTTCKFNIFMVE